MGLDVNMVCAIALFFLYVFTLKWIPSQMMMYDFCIESEDADKLKTP